MHFLHTFTDILGLYNLKIHMVVLYKWPLSASHFTWQSLCTRLEDLQPHSMQPCCSSLMRCLGCHSAFIVMESAALVNGLCTCHLCRTCWLQLLETEQNLSFFLEDNPDVWIVASLSPVFKIRRHRVTICPHHHFYTFTTFTHQNLHSPLHCYHW